MRAEVMFKVPLLWECFKCTSCEFWDILWDYYFGHVISTKKVFRSYCYRAGKFTCQLTDIEEACGIVNYKDKYGLPPRWKISIATFIHGVFSISWGIMGSISQAFTMFEMPLLIPGQKIISFAPLMVLTIPRWPAWS